MSSCFVIKYEMFLYMKKCDRAKQLELINVPENYPSLKVLPSPIDDYNEDVPERKINYTSCIYGDVKT